MKLVLGLIFVASFPLFFLTFMSGWAVVFVLTAIVSHVWLTLLETR